MSHVGKNEWVLNTGEIAGGSSKLMADLFNAAGSGYNVIIEGIFVRPKGDVAVSGVVAARFNFLRTSSAGTSGQTIGYASASETAASIIPFDTEQNPIPTGISARTTPTGGATITVRLADTMVFSEETSPAIYNDQHMNVLKLGRKIRLRPGQGLLIKQGSVASVNSYEFDVYFTVEERE